MIKIICVGKIKEKYLSDLINDYYNRIKKYYRIEIIELKDSNINEEAIEIKKYLNDNSYIICLDIKGVKVDTIEFKNLIENNLNSGNSNITFIIGASFGISEEIKKISNKLISFSDLTFPHGLFRGILLEQIYRSFKIMNNESYHK